MVSHVTSRKSCSPRKQDESACIYICSAKRAESSEYGFFMHALWDRDACGKLKVHGTLYRFRRYPTLPLGKYEPRRSCLRATKIPPSTPDFSRPLFLVILYRADRVHTMSTGFRGCFGDYGLAGDILNFTRRNCTK